MEPFWNAPWGSQPHFGDPSFTTTIRDAQALLPCPLLLPSEAALPEGLALSELRITPESDERQSEATLLYAGGRRRLVVRQFLYDWWRPTELTVGLTHTLGHWRSGDRVAAWGRNDRGHYTTVTAWGRTTAQIVVEQGTFVEWELRQFVAALDPALPLALPTLVEPAFPAISYHVRRGHGPNGVDELAAANWQTEIPSVLPSPILLPAEMPRGWRLDAVSTWPKPPPNEVQWLLRNESGQTLLYARARPTSDEQPLKLPASYRMQDGWTARQTMVRRRRATLASQHSGNGGWSAAWAEAGHRYQLWLRAGTFLSERAVREFIESLNKP